MKNVTKECISAKEFSIEIQRLVKEVMSSDFTELLGEDVTLDVFVEDLDDIVGASAVFCILFNNQGEVLNKNIQVYTDNTVNVSGGASLVYNKDILFQDAYFRIYQIIKFLVEYLGGDSELEDDFLSIAKEKLEINLKQREDEIL